MEIQKIIASDALQKLESDRLSEIESANPFYQMYLERILERELSNPAMLEGNLSAEEIHGWISSI